MLKLLVKLFINMHLGITSNKIVVLIIFVKLTRKHQLWNAIFSKV